MAITHRSRVLREAAELQQFLLDMAPFNSDSVAVYRIGQPAYILQAPIVEVAVKWKHYAFFITPAWDNKLMVFTYQVRRQLNNPRTILECYTRNGVAELLKRDLLKARLSIREGSNG